MTNPVCPVCGEPLDESGACVACDYAEALAVEPLSETDCYLLTHSLA